MNVLNKIIKNMFKIQIIQTFFVAILIIISTLQLNSFIVSENGFMPFYVISIFILIIIIFIMFIIDILKINKEKGNTKNIQNKMAVNILFILIELLLIGIICGLIEHSLDRMEFSKNCAKTKACIFEVQKDFNFGYVASKDEKSSCTVKFIYNFYYEINGKKYFHELKDSQTVYGEDRFDAEIRAKRIKSQYNEGESFYIYYNIENPDDWRKNIGYISKTAIYVLDTIAIVFQIYCLLRTKKEYDKVTLDIIDM